MADRSERGWRGASVNAAAGGSFRLADTDEAEDDRLGTLRGAVEMQGTVN